MKLLVEIPDRIYTTICFTTDNMIFDSDSPYVAKAIKNGQPIPDDCEVLTKEAYEDLCIRASESSGIAVWHSPKAMLPKHDKPVLVINDDGLYAVAFYKRNEAEHWNEWRIMYSPYDDDVWNKNEHGKIEAWVDLPNVPTFSPISVQEPSECEAEDVTFEGDNAVSRLSVRDIIYANAYELEYPDGSSEYVVNRDELIKYLMELPLGSTTKNDLAQERYQDLIEYFGDEKVAKTILESRKEFKAWLERIKWHVKRTDELARELEQIKSTTKNDLAVDCIVDVLGSYTDLDIPYKREIAENILTKLPSVTSQDPRWIPVSERLPENKETVLVTFKHFVSGNTIGLGSVILLRDKPHWHVREQNLGTYDVLAWKPLPKPYEPQKSEK